MNHEKRYQECGPLEKFWRRRHQLLVPYETVRGWLWERLTGLPRDRCHRLRTHWNLSRGIAQGRMNWIHELDPRFLADDGEP